MLTWFKTLMLPPYPLGVPRLLKAFNPEADRSQFDLRPGAPGEWSVKCKGPGPIPLFEIEGPVHDPGLLTYRLEMRSEGLCDPALLELCCDLPGHAPLRRIGWHHPLTDGSDWDYFEITQHLQPGQVPTRVRLSLVTDSPGTVWIRNAKVLVTPAG